MEVIKVHSKTTEESNFFEKTNPVELVKKYGSPLYVYSEKILRSKCQEIKKLVKYENFNVNYSAKANSNLEVLKIIREEGLLVDAMSPGEIMVELKAGFKPEDILYIGNNVSAEEMKFAIEKKVKVSVDSISQLKMYGELNNGGEVFIRFNPGVGAGHHKKVVTAGEKTKFGVDPQYIEEVKTVLKKYNLKLIGINQHIGSLFMDAEPYLKGAISLLEIAKKFKGLEVIDFGGGFGIPYYKMENQSRLNLVELGKKLDEIIENFVKQYGSKVNFRVEPGRYIVAESCVLLGEVYSKKVNCGNIYVGTDLGFNVLMRPVLYDSFHEIEIFREKNIESSKKEKVTIVGNICESGDIIAENRELPEIMEGDILCVLDAGAYGYAMSSNYNNRLRPAEVLITKDGNEKIIRKRDTYEDLFRGFVMGD